ncbi:MAG: type II CRISPR-associated endonuclease Cas1 [Acholeplasma sp.]|nr:type II CRISPR-associated endonuclease Cas1 [Acholeplasma sp.]
MSWRVVYIEESEYLSLYLDNIKITKNDEDILLPISDINTLILDNYKINLSVQLLNALSKANVNLVMCGIDHLPQTIILPISGHKLSFSMLKKQLEWSLEQKNFIHMMIIKNKIRNQKELLMMFKKNTYIIETLDRYINEVKLGDESNREGLAAKMYFRELFGEDFKRFSDDVVNSGLNYGYAVLRSQISKILIAKGLNTSIGFFHIGRENEFNLSDDIIEPFRPIVDSWVYRNLSEEKLFLREHRLNLVKLTTCNLTIDGKSQTLFNTIQIFVESILSNIENPNNKIKEVKLDLNGL